MFKRNDEFQTLLIVNGLFSLVLLLIDIFAAKWGSMNFFLILLIIVFHAGAVFTWFKSIQKFDDPNHDWIRKVVLVLVVIPSIIIMLHRAGWVENEMFKQDVEKAKQENAESKLIIPPQNDSFYVATDQSANLHIVQQKDNRKFHYDWFVVFYPLYKLSFTSENLIRGDNYKFLEYISKGHNYRDIGYKIKFDSGNNKDDGGCIIGFEMYDVRLKGETL